MAARTVLERGVNDGSEQPLRCAAVRRVTADAVPADGVSGMLRNGAASAFHVTGEAEIRALLRQPLWIRSRVGVMAVEAILGGRLVHDRGRELLPVVTREAEIIVRGPEQMRAVRRMRRMACRALPLRHRHVDVYGFELRLLRRVARVTELRHFFFENEGSH